MSTTICVINESTSLSSHQVQTMAGACRRQLLEEFVPAWGLGLYDFDVGVFTSVDHMPEDAFPIFILDDGNTPGALGWHSIISGMVDVNEASLMNVEVSTVLSHEILEFVGDPDVQRFRTDPWNGWQWALEVCDAVERGRYAIDGIWLSNWVTPAYFERGSHGPYDHMGHLSGPFTIQEGGYSIIKKPDGSVMHWPPGAMLSPRKKNKRSRTARRGIVCEVSS